MNYLIQFNVTKTEDGYIASSTGLHDGIFTEGETFEKLTRNIRKATSLYLKSKCDDDDRDGDEDEFLGSEATDRPFLLNVELSPLSEDEN